MKSKHMLATIVLIIIVVFSIAIINARESCPMHLPETTTELRELITPTDPVPIRDLVIQPLKTQVKAKTFLYLAQVANKLNRDTFGQLPMDEADIDYLTYSHIDPSASIYYPKSTWTEGRNMLYHQALLREVKQGWRYKYFIFVDADMQFSKETSVESQFRNWHRFLLEYEPAMASPVYHNRPPKLSDTMYSYGLIDAMFNAFHRDTFGILLPYSTYYDSKSWWASQAIIATRANLFYRGHIMMYGGISGYNAAHTPYPQGHPFTKDVLLHSVNITNCPNEVVNSTICFPPIDELTIIPEKKNMDYANPNCTSYMEESSMITKQHGAYSFGVFCV